MVFKTFVLSILSCRLGQVLLYIPHQHAAKALKSLSCLQIQNMDYDEDLDKIETLLSNCVVAHLCLNSDFNINSKTCVKRPLSKRSKIGFQDQFSLNTGQKYC